MALGGEIMRGEKGRVWTWSEEPGGHFSTRVIYFVPGKTRLRCSYEVNLSVKGKSWW